MDVSEMKGCQTLSFLVPSLSKIIIIIIIEAGSRIF